MSDSTKDRLAGAVREFKGKVKEKAGRAVGSAALENKGNREKVAGNARKKAGDIQKAFEK